MNMMRRKNTGGGRADQSCGQARVSGRASGWLLNAVLLLSAAAWSGHGYAVTCTSTAAGGNWNVTATWTGCAGGGGTPANTPGAADNVIIATSGAGAVAVNVQAAMTNLTINPGSILNVVGGSNYRIRPTGATSISGTLNFLGTSTSSSRFTGLVTVAGTGVWNNSGNRAITFRGGLTNNGSFTGGTGTQTFDTNSQALGGASAINFGGIVAIVGAITVTNNNTGIVTIANDLTGSVAGSTWVNAANSTLNYGGAAAPMGTRVFTANAAGNTVNYTGAAQVVKATPYANLGLGGSGTKTFSGVTTVGGNFTMSGTASVTTTSALTVGGNFSIGASNTFANGAVALNVAGNFAQNGTFTAGTGVVTLNGGAAVQTISGTGPLGFANLTVNNTGGITLARNVTVTSAIIGAVTLTNTCPANFTLTSNGGATVAQSCPTSTVTSINTASPNPTTIGSTVAWTVLFSNTVTGVTAANFALVQTGSVSGATITSVSCVGASCTVNANTGSGAGTLGLNMVNVTGITPPVVTAMPVTGQVYTVYPALTCVSDSFTGANNSVPNSINWDVQRVSGTFTPVIFGNRLRITDITGNAATRASNKNIFPFGNNLVIAEFDYWAYGGTGADGVAITFSDPNTPTPGANNPPTAGGFGGSLGYANRNAAGICNVAGFSGGWIGVGIDEYGNYSNPTECRNGGPGPRVNAVSIRGSGSGATSPSISNYAYLTGTAALGVNGVSSGTTATAYRYRITLDSVTDLAKVMVKVEQDKTGTGYLPLFSYDLKPQITAGSQLPLPPQLQFTFTGSTGGSTNYHEVDNLSICSAIVVSALNHVAISAPATDTALTAVPVTIAPHDAAHAAISNAGTINLSTSTGLGDWTIGGGTGTLTPGAANSGMATYTFGPGETSATLNFTYQTAGTVTLNVASSGGADLLLNTPVGEKANTIIFSMPGFIFTDSACVHNIALGAPGQTCALLNWSPQVAGQLLSNIYITALNAAGVPTRLHATQVRTVNMQYGLSCHDPIANAGKLATFSATAAVFPVCQASGAMPATWTAGANISFPAGIPSSGPFSFNYPDVGKVELWMRNSAAPTQTGSSGVFVVKPGRFVLSAIQQTAAPNLTNPAAANAAGAKFVKAGEAFSMTVTATTCSPASATCTVAGATTPNYGQEVTPESVRLTSALVAPVGGNNPAVGGTFGTFTNGVANGTTFTWNEVGIVTLTPGVASGSYLGAGDVTGTISANVGRFYPDHFDTAVVATATVPMPCPSGLTCPALYNGFIYSGQPFSLQVTARNLAGGTTGNYDGVLGFSKAVALTAWDALGGVTTQNPGGALANGAVASADFIAGAATTATPTYTLATMLTAPTDIYLRAQDTDNVSSLRAVSVEGGVKVASGRVKIGNAHGSELLDLPMIATVQYYSGTNWLNSASDSVTSLTLGLSNYQSKSGGAWTTTLSPASGQVNAGVLSFKLTKPTGGGTGSVDASITAPNYLLVGSNGAGINPSNAGRATFGVYKGNNEFIYLRESY